MEYHDTFIPCNTQLYSKPVIFIFLLSEGHDVQCWQNGFQSEGAMDHWKVLSVAMVDQQKHFLNYRHSRMAKIVTFWPWWQHFNSFCFETFFFICYTKKVIGTWSSPPPPTPTPVWPALKFSIISSCLGKDKVFPITLVCSLTRRSTFAWKQ